MIDELISNNCIKIGSFKLKNGDISKYYFDMKHLVSYPNLLSKIGDKMFELMDDCDILCGIPIGGIPIASYISTKYNKPMIIVRDSQKKYGTKKIIEGNYKKNDKCIIIDDVVTTGISIQNVINILKNKVNIVGVLVILNRQQNPKCSLPIKSTFTKTDIIRYRLNQLIKNKKSRLCFSADIEYPDKIYKILEDIGKHIIICKIHFDIIKTKHICDFKEKMIELSNKYNFLIMEDRKFTDISYIVEKQYKQFMNWIDLVTVHATVTNDVIKKLSGVMIISDMSNNIYNHRKDAIKLAENNYENVVGFITQKRITHNKLALINMTPGINLEIKTNDDQKYKNNVETDIIIVGRGIYNSKNCTKSCENYKKLSLHLFFKTF